ncbi:unnamed protein product [Amoebophrya sp. A120]|nr:unnamed protein product [Amoebophrya sp. A120]|eukprot:GSA120T00023256001.1
MAKFRRKQKQRWPLRLACATVASTSAAQWHKRGGLPGAARRLDREVVDLTAGAVRRRSGWSTTSTRSGATTSPLREEPPFSTSTVTSFNTPPDVVDVGPAASSYVTVAENSEVLEDGFIPISTGFSAFSSSSSTSTFRENRRGDGKGVLPELEGEPRAESPFSFTPAPLSLLQRMQQRMQLRLRADKLKKAKKMVSPPEAEYLPTYNEITNLSLDVQVRDLVGVVDRLKDDGTNYDGPNSCIKHNCNVRLDNRDITYRLDVDKKCGGDNPSCDDVCCPYVYCMVDLTDASIDHMYSGMSKHLKVKRDDGSSADTGPAFQTIQFTYCKAKKTVTKIAVPTWYDGSKEIAPNKFLQERVRANECLGRTGFFHWPALETPEAKNYVREKVYKNDERVPLARGYPLSKLLLKVDNAPDTSDKLNGGEDVKEGDEVMMRGQYKYTSVGVAWDNPLDSIQEIGGNTDTPKAYTKGEGADSKLPLRLIISDSRARDYPRLDLNYIDVAPTWHLPYVRSAASVGGSQGNEHFVPLEDCCQYVIQMMRDENYLTVDGRVSNTEMLAVTNCVVFAYSMHDHLEGKPNTRENSGSSGGSGGGGAQGTATGSQ